MKLTEINEWAKQALKDGPTSCEKLRETLPTLMDGMNTISGLEKGIKEVKARLKKLSDKSAKYATEHPQLMDSCVTRANGVESITIEVDGITYRCALGYDGYKRIDGDDMDSEFLMGLPKDWVVSRLRLSTTGVNKSNPTAEELEKHGLYQVPKNVWSVG